MVNVVVKLIVEMLLCQSLFYFLDHRRDVVKPDLCEGVVPVSVRAALWVEESVALAVAHTTVVRQPDIVTCMPQLDRNREARTAIVLMQPRISRHVYTMVEQYSLLHIPLVRRLLVHRQVENRVPVE